MAGPLVLVYNLDARAEGRLRVVCGKLGVRMRRVGPESYALPIGALAGIPTAQAAPDAPQGGFDAPMLVMCNMLSGQLDAFLQGMRAGGVPRVALKAVLTPSNVAWNSLQLHNELAREHAAVQAARPREGPGGTGNQ